MTGLRRTPCLLLLIGLALACRRSAALDTRMWSHPPEQEPSRWDNLEFQVTNFPHLKFNDGGIVSYRLNWLQVGVDYKDGHPAYALAQAPFLALPVSLALPAKLVPVQGVDLTLRMNVPVIALGDGTRPPVELGLNLSVQVDSMLRSLAPIIPTQWLLRAD